MFFTGKKKSGVCWGTKMKMNSLMRPRCGFVACVFCTTFRTSNTVFETGRLGWKKKTWLVRLHGNFHQISNLPPGGFKCNLLIARLPRNCREFTRFTVADFCDRPLSREGVDIGSSSGQRQFSHPSRMFEWSNKKVFPALRISYKQRDQFQNKGHASVITGAKIRSGRPPA